MCKYNLLHRNWSFAAMRPAAAKGITNGAPLSSLYKAFVTSRSNIPQLQRQRQQQP